MSATSSRCSKTGSASTLTYCWLMASGSSKACSPSSLNRAAMACRSAVVFAPSGSSASPLVDAGGRFRGREEDDLHFHGVAGHPCRRSLYCVRLRARCDVCTRALLRLAAVRAPRGPNSCERSFVCHCWSRSVTSASRLRRRAVYAASRSFALTRPML